MAAAEELLGRQDYTAAAERLGGLLTANPQSPYAPLARLKLAFAYLRLSRFDDAATLLRQASPESRKRVEVLLMLAEAEEGAGRVGAAFEAAEEALRQAGERPVLKTCQYRLKGLGQRLSAADAEALGQRFQQGYAAGVVRFRQAQLAAEAGRTDVALKLLDTFGRDFPGHDLGQDADTLRRQLEGEGRGGPPAAAKQEKLHTIGVLIPQGGGFRAVGDQVLKGLVLATGVFAAEPVSAKRFRLAVRGLGQNAQTAAEGVKELAMTEDALVVVALLDAAHAEAAAREAQRLGLPLLALCQDPKLPVGGGVFRNFLTPRQQVESLAQFAASRGLTSIAVLYPRDGYGKEMAALMRAAAPTAGVTIAAEASYEPAYTSVAEPIKQLLKQLPAKKPGQEELPFQAVFLPEGSQRALTILPQFSYAGLRGLTFLGPNLWNDARLAKGLAGFSGAVFFADAFDPASFEPAVLAFAQGWREEFGEEPGYLAAQSYDDAWIIIRAVEAGAASREDLVRLLSGLREFPGVTGRTSFSEAGEAAKSPQVLTVSGGQIRPAN
jgi:branched-chain amino acid transport system substrate-binding protein